MALLPRSTCSFRILLIKIDFGTEQAERVYVVIGQRSSSQLLIDFSAEQLGTHHPWILPNI
jgi:hypothetical protein